MMCGGVVWVGGVCCFCCVGVFSICVEGGCFVVFVGLVWGCCWRL